MLNLFASARDQLSHTSFNVVGLQGRFYSFVCPTRQYFRGPLFGLTVIDLVGKTTVQVYFSTVVDSDVPRPTSSHM